MVNLFNVNNNFWYGEKTEDNKNIGLDIAEIVVKSFGTKSKNEARKLIESGAIRWNGHKIIDPFARISLHNDDVLIRMKNNFEE
jgi:predicted rRNA methylase YqxC with S4 and FtsJ domains